MSQPGTDDERLNLALVESHLDELRVVRRLSPNTIESYQRDLRSLLRHASAQGQSRGHVVPRPELEAHVRDLMTEQSLSAVCGARGRVHPWVLSLSSRGRGRIEVNPATELRAPRCVAEPPKIPVVRGGRPSH